jgi:hypothetical protein
MALDPWSLITGCLRVVTVIYDTIKTDRDNSQLIDSLGSEAVRVKTFLERLMGRASQLETHEACEQLGLFSFTSCSAFAHSNLGRCIGEISWLHTGMCLVHNPVGARPAS